MDLIEIIFGIVYPFIILFGFKRQNKKLLKTVTQMDHIIDSLNKSDEGLRLGEKLDLKNEKARFADNLREMMRSMHEFRAFADTSNQLKVLLTDSSFVQFFIPFVPWVKSLYENRVQRLFRVLVSCLIIYFIFAFIHFTKGIYNYPQWFFSPSVSIIETGLILIHIGAILTIFYILISPFIQQRKLHKGSALLERREPSEYYPKWVYNSLFGVGLSGYIIYLYHINVSPMLSVIFAFVHVSLIGMFSEKIVEKGSPLDPSDDLGNSANKAILFIQHSRITIASLAVVFAHFVFLNMLIDDSRTDAFHIIPLLYILLILGVQLFLNFRYKTELSNEFVEHLFKRGTIDEHYKVNNYYFRKGP